MAKVTYGDPRDLARVSFDDADGMYRLLVRGAALVIKPDEAACLRDALTSADRLPATGGAHALRG